MSIEVKIPAVGESITEALLSQWFKKEGDTVQVDEPIAELETDKVTVELPSPASGTLSKLMLEVGATAKVGDVIAMIEEGAVTASPAATSAAESPEESPRPEEDPPATQTPAAEPPVGEAQPPSASASSAPRVMPSAERLMEQKGIVASQLEGTGPGGRILKEDVERALDSSGTEPEPHGGAEPATSLPATTSAERIEERVKMTPIRKRIAERLVAAQENAALLTTFNEVDMSAVMDLRSEHKEAFQKRYGIKLGFMSFFVKASVDALRQFPKVNAQIEGDEIVYRNYFDIGMAVSTDRGLMVPVLRSAERLSFAEVELGIADFAGRAREGKIKLEDLQGGTFTITNGGIFGSMLSTPIINPPQSAVLGLHAIQDRPVAIDGKVEVRPMMYLALTYDHRMVDGREAVTFLRRIKEGIEEPARMLLEI